MMQLYVYCRSKNCIAAENIRPRIIFVHTYTM